jgi:periplasmic protein TonB
MLKLMKSLNSMIVKPMKATIIDAVPQIQQKEEEEEESEVFVVVEDMPEFPVEKQRFVNGFNNNVKVSSIAAENGIQGKVYVTLRC